MRVFISKATDNDKKYLEESQELKSGQKKKEDNSGSSSLSVVIKAKKIKKTVSALKTLKSEENK